MPKKTPSYRQRKGYDQAIVTLTDAVTKHRRDYWLGAYGSPESRELYHQVLAEWEAAGRRLPQAPTNADGPVGGVTINEMTNAYWRWAKFAYSSSEVSSTAQIIRMLRQMFGSLAAASFGPKRLRLVREAMVSGDPDADPPRVPWSRPTVNKQVHRLCFIFKWAAGQEMIPISVYQQLKAIEPLKRGRTKAREPEPVGPVADHLVNAIEPFVSRQVWALVQLQRLTGARGGELFRLRPVGLKMDEKSGIWTYSPTDHKTAHHGKSRTLYFGPRAQAVIRPFLTDRPVDGFLFSPAEAETERAGRRRAERTTPLGQGNGPLTNCKVESTRKPGDHYTHDSYHRAIQRACDDAFPPPAHLARTRVPARGRKENSTRWENEAEWKKRLGSVGWAELKAWRKAHRWHPHQLRHAAGTRIRREFGLEAAQIALGHSSALVTDAVYAERDTAKVVEMMKKIG